MDREAAKAEARRRVAAVRMERGAFDTAFDPLFTAMLSEPTSSMAEAFLRTLEELPLLRLVKDETDD